VDRLDWGSGHRHHALVFVNTSQARRHLRAEVLVVYRPLASAARLAFLWRDVSATCLAVGDDERLRISRGRNCAEVVDHRLLGLGPERLADQDEVRHSPVDRDHRRVRRPHENKLGALVATHDLA
jgi:hypothetical protein